MRRLNLLLLGLLGLPLAVAGWLWLTLLSPFTYDRPEGLTPVGAGPHHVFVYGTLRSGLVRWLVMGRSGESETTLVEGFRREGLDLEEAPGEEVEGEVIEVSARELSRLDRYERLGIRYERVRIELGNGQEAWVYRRLEEAPATEAGQ